MDTGLAGKCALVAGGSSGIGLAIAIELAREGAHVAIGAREPDRLAEAERAVKEVASGQVHATSVDTDRHRRGQALGGRHRRHRVRRPARPRGERRQPAVRHGDQLRVDDYPAAVDQVLLPAVSLTLAALPHLRAAGLGRLS